MLDMATVATTGAPTLLITFAITTEACVCGNPFCKI